MMSDAVRFRGLLAWGHIYFLLTFRWWYADSEVFSKEGFLKLHSLPVWYLENIPRFGLSTVQLGLEILLSLSVLGCILAYREKTARFSWYLLAPLFLSKSYLYLLDLRQFTSFHHMHLLMVFLIMVSKQRLFGPQCGLVIIYLVSGLGKLNPSWTQAKYFRSLDHGLPFFGSAEIVLLSAAWAVILLELFGPLFWFAANRKLRLMSVVLFTLFHFYGGFIVGFPYTILMVPLLYLLLWPSERPLLSGYGLERRDAWTWLVLVGVFLLSLLPWLIESDVRLTAEGRYFSISNMFDGNRSIRFEAKFRKDGTDYLLRVERPYSKVGFYEARSLVMLSLNNQPLQVLSDDLVLNDGVVISPHLFQNTHVRIAGDPYLYLYASQKISESLRPETLSVKLEAGLNGERDLRLVFFIADFHRESIQYQPWGGNAWLSVE